LNKLLLDFDAKIYIAGHKGMVGLACWRALEKKGFFNLVGLNSSELDLTNQNLVHDFFLNQNIDVVIDAAAKVGGILANSNYPYDFLLKNMQIQNNLIESANKFGVKKFIFLGSSCIYPKMAIQPIKEEYLLNGKLEPTNECYAIAKISGLKLCEAIKNQFNKEFISLMPTNLYGPNDNFDLESSHVLPAMIRKFHTAKENNYPNVTLWGSGRPMREFLHVDDLANAIIFSLENYMEDSLYNIGTGKDISIKELAFLIKKITGYEGQINWDSSKPDGTPRKVLDVYKIEKKGWSFNIELNKGIKDTYLWYLKNKNNLKEIKL